MVNKKKIITYILTAIVLVGAYLRLYNLNWDGNFYFHPDERNIADAVSQINYSGCITSFFSYQQNNIAPSSNNICNLNPHFFAYGTLPIYIARLFVLTNDFKSIILTLRVESAFFSILSIFAIYLLLRKLFEKTKHWQVIALTGALLMAIDPGMIQFAHFGTFESILTFEYLLFFLACLNFLKYVSFKNLILVSIAAGVSIATKMTSLVLLAVVFILFVRLIIKKLYGIKQIFRNGVNVLLVIALVVFICSPYILLDFQSFLGSMNYEGPVASGVLQVFYTQEFIGTIPGLYQFTKIFPYILGIPLTVIGFSGFIFVMIYLIRQLIKRRFNDYSWPVFVFIAGGLVLFIFNLVLFVKWTRYMDPLTPLLIIFSLILGYFVYTRFASRIYLKYMMLAFFATIVLYSSFLGLQFFKRYTEVDPRILMGNWAETNISKDAFILTEPYDLSATALNAALPAQVHDFDIYSTDANTATYEQFKNLVNKADYFIVLSNRLYTTRFRLKSQFPDGYNFYNDLNSGKLGFTQIAHFNREDQVSTKKIDLSDPNFYLSPDETFNVFDNPTIIVFKRNA